jgi:hypothetical protein
MNIKLLHCIDLRIISFMGRFSAPDHVLPSNNIEGFKAPANHRILVARIIFSIISD